MKKENSLEEFRKKAAVLLHEGKALLERMGGVFTPFTPSSESLAEDSEELKDGKDKMKK